MNEAALMGFRQLAAAMAGPEPQNWQWVGPYMSQRMFGISEKRAKEYAARHGGEAKKMPPQPAAWEIEYEKVVAAAAAQQKG
jgi:hypothetical protein